MIRLSEWPSKRKKWNLKTNCKLSLATVFISAFCLPYTFDSNIYYSHTVDSTAKNSNAKDSDASDNNSFEGAPTSTEDDKKKKKKRNDPKSLLALVDDSSDDGGGGAENYSHSRYDPSQTYVNHFRSGDDNLNECPILDAIDKRCESVDLLSGGGGRNIFENDSLLPACSMHQFCYLCVSINLKFSF